MSDDILKCPRCGKIMVQRERHSDNQPFYGCSDYPNCRGTRSFEEGIGKVTQTPSFSNYGDEGRCLRCGQYPAYGSLSTMGLCPTCQDHFDNE